MRELGAFDPPKRAADTVCDMSLVAPRRWAIGARGAGSPVPVLVRRPTQAGRKAPIPGDGRQGQRMVAADRGSGATVRSRPVIGPPSRFRRKRHDESSDF